MCAAPARTEQKYSIPRNPLMPEPSVLDILFSGTVIKTPDGNAAPIAVPLFRATGEAGSQFSMQQRGVLYYFKHGLIYVYDAAQTVAMQLFDGVKLSAAFVLPGIGEMAGGLSELVQKGGEILLEKVGDTIKERQSPAQETFGDQVKMLESRGVVLLSGANLVDVEYQVEPAGFLSKETHRLIYTYENTQHQVTRYQTGAPSKGKKAEAANMMINQALNTRMWAEVDYLFQTVKNEYAPGFDATRSEMRTAFEQQHGEGTADRSQEFVKEVTERFQAETERNGFTPAECGRRTLELLEPMREVYDKTPMLSAMMQNLRAMAAGQTS